eukprot:jgi/Chrpa1/19739/Chrysochromulina_OHIO_Genome00022877-RA
MAAMVYTLSMTSDVALFTATIRGGHGNQKLAKARKCHGLKIMDGVLDLPRKPSDAEHEAVLGRLTSALGAMPSDTDVQTWLGAELVAAIAAMKSASASAPSPRRTVAEPRKLAAGPGSALGAYELKFASEHWRLHHPSWSEGVTVNHNRKASYREQHRVHELLGRLLAAYVPAPCRGREEARELLEITLLRLQLRDPQQLSLNKFMESSPTHLWFTVDFCAATLSDDKRHLLEPSLLDEERWLEDNELLALAAKVMLGSTPAEYHVGGRHGAPSDPILFVITDSIPISQKRCPKGGKDEGLPIARLYAAGCAEEEAEEGGEGCGDGAEGAAGSTSGGKQKEAAAKADLRKVLNAKAVPDARVRRSLRPDVPIAHFGTGAGWDDDFDRLATGLSGRPRLLAPFLAKNEKVSVAALEPCLAVSNKPRRLPQTKRTTYKQA